MNALNKIALACLIFVVGGCGSSSNPDQSTQFSLKSVKQSGPIKAGWAPYAPYAFRKDDGNPGGYYIELMNRVAEEADLDVMWVETTWGTMISDLKTSKFEVMAAPVFMTVPRALEVSFTIPIDFFGLSALSRSDNSQLRTLADIQAASQLKIAVTQGEVGHEYATRHLPNAELLVHKGGDISLALLDVIEGKADVGIADSWTIKLFHESHPTTTKNLFADKPFNQVGAGWYVDQEHQQLLNFLNTSITWLKTSGERQRIAKQYELPSTEGLQSEL